MLRTSLIHIIIYTLLINGWLMMCCSFEAMRFSKPLHKERLTTYLNRDADNESLSKSINRTFMLSWLRALSYINQQFQMICLKNGC